MNLIAKTLLIFAVLAAVTGCRSKQEFLYLADMNDNQDYAITQRYLPKVQRDDKLQITVTCKNPELAVPFNVAPGTVSVSASGNVQGRTVEHYYRVNNDGDINFPVLGELSVAGLTLPEVSELIRNRIIEGNYIKDPIVTIEFKNFHYTVLGAANGNGNFTCDGDRITILEAIARAGDLSTNADLGNIAVIRENGNKRQVHTVDIRKTDLFNSPVYYLAQNDIIYVRPKKPKKEAQQSILPWISVIISALSVATSIIWVTR